jgi:hypothetical protein
MNYLQTYCQQAILQYDKRLNTKISATSQYGVTSNTTILIFEQYDNASNIKILFTLQYSNKRPATREVILRYGNAEFLSAIHIYCKIAHTKFTNKTLNDRLPLLYSDCLQHCNTTSDTPAHLAAGRAVTRVYCYVINTTIPAI